jgi:hypothetical protein
MDVFAQLSDFRQAAYECLCRAKDATFELMDAVLLTRNAYSLADLSMCPVFRRKWSSIYEAIQDTRPQRNKLMQLYIEQIPKQGRIILAGDYTAWSRPEADTLKERTYEHYAQGGFSGRPVTVGYGYSTICWVPEMDGSWSLPLRLERITGWENPIDKSVWQLRQVCRYLPSRPLTFWDIEYGCAAFVIKTANINNVRLAYSPGLQQGSYLQLRMKQRPEKIKKVLLKYREIAKHKYRGGNTNDHANLPNGVPTTFFIQVMPKNLFLTLMKYWY